MAVVTRKYVFVGVNDTFLDRTVQARAKIVESSSSHVVVQVDDSVDGIIPTVDEQMADRGFVYDARLTGDTDLTIRSPNGSKWAITVSDAGVLAARKVP